MMKVAVYLAFLGTASAFMAPTVSRQTTTTTVVSAEMSKALPFLTKPALLDGTLPGDAGFDPLGLSEIDDVGFDLYWMREAEIKHGRVAMLATVGFLFTELCGPLPGWPLAEGRSQVDVFWDACDEHPNAMVSAFLMIGVVELVMGVAITKGRESGSRTPGDYGFNPLAYKITPELSLKEIKNGRLAMWAAAGMIAQGTLTHETLLTNVAKTWS